MYILTWVGLLAGGREVLGPRGCLEGALCAGCQFFSKSGSRTSWWIWLDVGRSVGRTLARNSRGQTACLDGSARRDHGIHELNPQEPANWSYGRRCSGRDGKGRLGGSVEMRFRLRATSTREAPPGHARSPRLSPRVYVCTPKNYLLRLTAEICGPVFTRRLLTARYTGGQLGSDLPAVCRRYGRFTRPSFRANIHRTPLLLSLE